MIEISIHMPSILIGFLLGYVVVTTVMLLVFFGEKWHNGFSAGWEGGKKFAEDRMKEKENKTDEPNNQTDR